jgi:hypothetical protein
MEEYPPVQFSLFIGSGSGRQAPGQLVFRGATAAEVADMIRDAFQGDVDELTGEEDPESSPVERIVAGVEQLTARFALANLGAQAITPPAPQQEWGGQQAPKGNGGNWGGQRKTNYQQPQAAPQGMVCARERCGGVMEFRQGVSAKNGRPWKGMFCPLCGDKKWL